MPQLVPVRVIFAFEVWVQTPHIVPPEHNRESSNFCLKKIYSWFSHACRDLLLISEQFSHKFVAFDFRHCRTAGKSVKQQSRVVTIEKKKKTY